MICGWRACCGWRGEGRGVQWATGSPPHAKRVYSRSHTYRVKRNNAQTRRLLTHHGIHCIPKRREEKRREEGRKGRGAECGARVGIGLRTCSVCASDLGFETAVRVSEWDVTDRCRETPHTGLFEENTVPFLFDSSPPTSHRFIIINYPKKHRIVEQVQIPLPEGKRRRRKEEKKKKDPPIAGVCPKKK